MNRGIWTYRPELLLFLLLFGTYAYFYQSTQHNEASRFDQMRSIVENHTVAINKYWWNTADIIHYPKDGSDHIYPNKAPGMTLVELVPYLTATGMARLMQALGFPAWGYWHMVVYLTTLLGVGALSAVAGVAIHRVISRLTGDRYFGAIVVAGVWLGTLVFPYSTLFFSHAFAGSLLALAFFALFCFGHDSEARFSRRALYTGLAGLLMSFSVAAEYPSVLLAALLFGYGSWLIWKCESTWAARGVMFGLCLAGALTGAIMLLVYNHVAFGKMFYIPYESYAKAGGDFSKTYTHGWLGMQWNGMRHFIHALASITVYPQIGMLYLGLNGWRVYACNPVLWLCLPGFLVMLWRRSLRLEGLLILAMTTLYLLFVTNYGASIYDWSGASYLGSRHLVPLLPFLALPLYFGARYLRPIFYPLMAVSIFYMLIATATEPRVAIPYENTARDLLIPDYLRARFAQNTDALFEGQRNFVKDSAAFNWGKLAGLPSPYQLVPLLLWWALTGGALLLGGRNETGTPGGTEQEQFVAVRASVKRRRFPAARTTGLAVFIIIVSLPPIVHYAAASSNYKNRGLLGKYYHNATCSGVPVETEIDPQINFDWTKSLPLQPPFSVEWSGQIAIDHAGDFQFGLIADDGAILFIDGKVVVDASTGAILQKRMGMIHLNPGLHPIQIRYFNPMFGGLVKLSWIGASRVEEIVPNEVLIPPPQPKSSPR